MGGFVERGNVFRVSLGMEDFAMSGRALWRWTDLWSELVGERYDMAREPRVRQLHGFDKLDPNGVRLPSLVELGCG